MEPKPGPVPTPVAATSAESDRRDAERTARLLPISVQGSRSSYNAMLLDVSVGGAMIAVVDDRLEIVEHADPTLDGLRLASAFGEGLILHLPGGVSIDAEIVRFSVGALGERNVFCIACRFLEDLSEHAVAALGLGQSAIGAIVAPPPVAADAPPSDDDPIAADVLIRSSGERMGMQQILTLAVKRHATDVHIKAGSPVRMRIDGDLVVIGDRALASEDARALVRQLLDPEQFARFEECGDADLAYSLEGQARFRVNALRARGELGLAIRRIPEIVPTIDELGLSPACAVLAERPRGLVLVTGPTGSGKSTTLAAMIQHVNQTRPCHIVTMEDPIEYIHTEYKAHVTQREIGRDTRDFASALKRALRQDPDVILVGEMRDLETIGLAVTSAETGHLVFATLHTTSAVLTVDRIVDVFPPAQQRQIRMQLADALQGIICQILLPRTSGGVVVAQEVLVATGGVRALIREGKTPQIGNMMQTGSREGMQTLEDSLNDLVERRVIGFETALAKANDPKQIRRPADAAPGPRRPVAPRLVPPRPPR